MRWMFDVYLEQSFVNLYLVGVQCPCSSVFIYFSPVHSTMFVNSFYLLCYCVEILYGVNTESVKFVGLQSCWFLSVWFDIAMFEQNVPVMTFFNMKCTRLVLVVCLYSLVYLSEFDFVSSCFNLFCTNRPY